MRVKIIEKIVDFFLSKKTERSEVPVLCRAFSIPYVCLTILRLRPNLDASIDCHNSLHAFSLFLDQAMYVQSFFHFSF